MFATNAEFSRWGTVLAEDRLAAAIAGRVVRHGGPVEFGGPGRRLERSLVWGGQEAGGVPAPRTEKLA